MFIMQGANFKLARLCVCVGGLVVSDSSTNFDFRMSGDPFAQHDVQAKRDIFGGADFLWRF